jgi:RNA polymerase sigma factor (sigma-70 family)
MLKDEEKAENDSWIWEALQSGDNSAFEAIFEANYTFLFNYGIRFQEDEDEVKECIQLLFITIWERRSYLGPTTSIRNYLLASLRRLLLKRKKEQATKVELDAETFTLYTELSAEALMIEDQSSVANLNLLQNSIEKLPERQKEALYLRFYGNQPFPEIALVMNITTRAVYKLIYKALDTLNEEISKSPRD